MSFPFQVELIRDTGAAVQKLYQQIARQIAAAIAGGRYVSGAKLPSEREFADDFGVSRPTIRDAMIALEFQGLVEARQGSGVYVSAAPPSPEYAAEPEISALELAEARRLFEGEACALAAATITDEQLATTGFDLPKPRTHTSEPVAAPGNLRLRLNGTSGEVEVLCDSVPRAKAYEAQFALDPNAAQWTDAGTFESLLHANNLVAKTGANKMSQDGEAHPAPKETRR